MRFELCIDLEVSDVDILLRAARALNMPLDALVKAAIAAFISRALTPVQPVPQKAEGGGS
jgi:hypothetical protein